jgi:plasmid stabilization system protein ParE
MTNSYDLTFTPAIVADFEALENYLFSNFSSETSKAVMQRLHSDILRLKTSPKIGRKLCDIHPEMDVPNTMMRLLSGQNLIFYEIDEHRFVIDLLRAIRGERDYIQELFPEQN